MMSNTEIARLRNEVMRLRELHTNELKSKSALISRHDAIVGKLREVVSETNSNLSQVEDEMLELKNAKAQQYQMMSAYILALEEYVFVSCLEESNFDEVLQFIKDEADRGVQ